MTIDWQHRADDVKQFKQEFRPGDDAKYEWLLGYARERYEATNAVYVGYEARATSVITHLGSGTGLLTLGAVAGVANNTIQPAVALAGLAPFTVALLAIVFAVLARSPRRIGGPPAALEVARLFDRGEFTENDLIAHYDGAGEAVRRANHARSWNLGWSLWLMTASVALLAVPLLTAIGPKAGWW